MGGVFPLIGESYFRHLGIGQGSSLLAGISLVLLPVFYVRIYLDFGVH